MEKIAFLCTGNEIVSGEILDTNAPYFSEQLTDKNFQLGMRLVVSDDQKEMESAIRFLLKDHAVLITLGGLGPTSDDRTRFALSDALEQLLQFDEASWERIVSLLNRLQLDIPENNRQQCLFPKHSEVYPNDNGSASACCITHGEQLIFMLPGPPNECRPIFEKYVLPKLLAQKSLQQKVYRRSWMLLGVSEGKIAKGLDALVEGSQCEIGYRVNIPYLEVKLQSPQKAAIEATAPLIEAQIQNRLISRDKKTASELFYQYLQRTKKTLSILDQATQGRLASELLQPETYKKVFFNEIETDINIKLEGLDAYWEKRITDYTSVRIEVSINEKSLSNQTIKVPMRKEKTLKYAIELICESLIKTLKGILISN